MALENEVNPLQDGGGEENMSFENMWQWMRRTFGIFILMAMFLAQIKIDEMNPEMLITSVVMLVGAILMI